MSSPFIEADAKQSISNRYNWADISSGFIGVEPKAKQDFCIIE